MTGANVHGWPETNETAKEFFMLKSRCLRGKWINGRLIVVVSIIFINERKNVYLDCLFCVTCVLEPDFKCLYLLQTNKKYKLLLIETYRMHLSKSIISEDMSISHSRVSPNSCKNLLSAFELVECCFLSSGMIGS